MCQEDWEAAMAFNEEGRGYYPEDAEFLFQAGQIYHALQRFEEGQRALERLAYGQESPH
jgi:hypothetical protein